MANYAVYFLVLAYFLQTAQAYSGDATWYNPSAGIGACGTHHGDNELVAATAFHFWTTPNPNLDPMCQRSARVTNPANGASVVVRIRDKCYGCASSDIDLSPAAFLAIQPGGLGVGRFRVNWDLL